NSGELHVSVFPSEPKSGREVGICKARTDVGELEAFVCAPQVSARAGPLQRDLKIGLAVFDRLPEHQHVPEEDHPVRSPVIEDVGKDVDVHERTPELPAAELAPLSPREPQPNRRQSRVDADAAHVELELREGIAVFGRRAHLDAKATLTSAEIRVAVRIELGPERRQLRWSHDVEPERVDAPRVEDHIPLAEAVDLHLRRGVPSRGALSPRAVGNRKWSEETDPDQQPEANVSAPADAS